MAKKLIFVARLLLSISVQSAAKFSGISIGFGSPGWERHIPLINPGAPLVSQSDSSSSARMVLTRSGTTRRVGGAVASASFSEKRESKRPSAGKKRRDAGKKKIVVQTGVSGVGLTSEAKLQEAVERMKVEEEIDYAVDSELEALLGTKQKARQAQARSI